VSWPAALLRRLQSKPDPLLAMTTAKERAYFESYARSTYSGAGSIVDLGCWLGATTASLARGLARNRNPQAATRRIQAYDQFLWEDWMSDWVRGTDLEGRYKNGESFVDEFRRRTAAWSGRIDVHAGDLCRLGWDAGPIEFLLVDVMKSWELANVTVRRFFTALIPGRSYVLEQDFSHPWTSWLHLIHYRLRDCFRLIHVVPGSQSFVFKCVRAVPIDRWPDDCTASSFSAEEVDRAFEHSVDLAVDRQTRATIAAAKVMHYFHAGDLARARAEFERFSLRGYPIGKDVEDVRALVAAE